MKFVFLSVFITFLSACNLNQNVSIRGVDLHTHEQDGNTMVDLEAIVSLGNLKLPNTNFPIQSNDKQDIGEGSIQQLDDGTSRIAFSLNYNEADKLDLETGKTLPNHREIPALLASDEAFYGIQVLQNSRVYIGGNPKETLYAGVVLNVPAFDHIIAAVPEPLNLFMTFPFSSEVSGVAGIYSSPRSGENGLAVFAKKSQQDSNILASAGTPTESQKLDRLTLFRLNYLFGRHATVRIK